MQTVSKQTLDQLLREFPTYEWEDQDLSDLVSPQHGVITGFQELLEEIKSLQEIDLDQIGPAEGITP